MKCCAADKPDALFGRTPQGVRGLKYLVAGDAEAVHIVAPRKGCVD